MTFKIPLESKKFSQTNKGDRSGNIYATKNINFDEEGYLKLSHRAVSLITEEDDADFDTTDSMFVTDQGVFFNADNLFTSTTIGDTAPTDLNGGTNVPTPGIEDDGIYFNDTEVVSDGTALYYQSGSNVWTTISSVFASGYSTQLAIFGASLMTGNQNLVKLINTSWATTVTLTLPSAYEVTSLDSNGNTAYIGTRHKARGEAKLFTWDGTATSANSEYGCGTFEISSVKKYGNSVACVLSDGRLVRFNGGGFDTLAELPVYKSGNEWMDSQNDHSRISHRGMVVVEDLIYLRLDSENGGYRNRYQTNFPGGVWCYDPAVGLYHRYSPSYTKFTQVTIATTNVDTTTNIITTTSVPITGTPCIYYSLSTTIAPLKNYEVYYVIKLSSTTLKLATTYDNAIAGTAIDLTSTGYAFQYINFYNVKDYGWSYANYRGAILKLTSNNYTPALADDVIFTAELANASLTTKTTLNLLHPKLPNRGWVMTPKLVSESVKDVFQKLYLKFKPLKDGDSIVIKYRTTEREGLPFILTENTNDTWTGTWSDTDTFTTTADLSDIIAGDEVEIVGGVGAGFIAHVSSITENAGTYTVNLDEAFPFATATDKMYFSIDNWTKIETLTNSNTYDFAEIPLSQTSKWIQFKIELRGLDVTVEELTVVNVPFKVSA